MNFCMFFFWENQFLLIFLSNVMIMHDMEDIDTSDVTRVKNITLIHKNS